MLLFLDTEFTDFHDSDLISLALVSECGRYEFYAERTDFDVSRCNEFVRSTVLPKLGVSNAGPGPLDRKALAVALHAWLNRLHDLDPGSYVMVFYDFDTDFKLLVEALCGEKPAWLEGANISDQVNPISWAKSALDDSQVVHHALYDARELRADWIATLNREAIRFVRPDS